MGDSIQNPRRAPRVPVRCEARVALREGGFWASPTSDYGPRGCQLLAPSRLEPGARIFLELSNERVPEPVALAGRVAWVARAPPWRMGVAFDEGGSGAAGAFFARLTAAYPGIDTYGRTPERIPGDAPLAPALPPEVAPLLTDDERRLLAILGAGGRADALPAGFGGDWSRAVHALFSLLGRRYVVFGEPDRDAAAAWAPLLERAT